MNWIVAKIKWIMLVSGVLTMLGWLVLLSAVIADAIDFGRSAFP